ncbi:MAG: hypothetical protein ACOCY0_01965 [Roseicyclus sp.]
MRCAPATISRRCPGQTRVRALAGRCALAAALALSAPAAFAGPWAREAGDVFLSFGVITEDATSTLMLGYLEPEFTGTVYGEVGLGRRFTAGLQLDYGEVSQMGVVFVRRTLTAPDTRVQLAVDAGLGLRRIEGRRTEQRLRAGASAGLGIGDWSAEVGPMTLGHEGGWLSLDAMALMDREGKADPILKLELTMGLNLTDRAASLLTVAAEDWPGAERLVTLRPSFTYAIAERTRIQAGAHAAVRGADTVGLSLSIWQEF